jgi:hypothetical protein
MSCESQTQVMSPLTTHLDEFWTHYLSLRLTIFDKEMTKNALVVELVTFWLEHIKILS